MDRRARGWYLLVGGAGSARKNSTQLELAKAEGEEEVVKRTRARLIKAREDAMIMGVILHVRSHRGMVDGHWVTRNYDPMTEYPSGRRAAGYVSEVLRKSTKKQGNPDRIIKRPRAVKEERGVYPEHPASSDRDRDYRMIINGLVIYDHYLQEHYKPLNNPRGRHYTDKERVPKEGGAIYRPYAGHPAFKDQIRKEHRLDV